MMPSKKIFTSKSVYLVLIFLSSSTFGFLESDFRDAMSRKNVRGNRGDSFNKEFLEDLPFRRDISRQENKKDRVYQNLYDRRSFRTGTDRQIRITEKERLRNTREINSEVRDSSERYERLYQDAKSLPSNNRQRFFQERSRTLQNDRIDMRSSRISRENREQNHKQRSPRASEGSFQNQVGQREPSIEKRERLFVTNNKARQISEQPLVSRNSRAWQVRDQLTNNRFSSKSSLKNQDPAPDNRVRQILERSLENRFRMVSRDNRFRQIRSNTRSQRENRERLASSDNNRARQIRKPLTDIRISNERTLKIQEYFPGYRIRQIHKNENKIDKTRQIGNARNKMHRENREQLFKQINKRSQLERSFENGERLTSFNNIARQSPEQSLTDIRIRNMESGHRNNRQFRERGLENPSSFRNDIRFSQKPERENILVQDAAILENTRARRYATDHRYNIISEFNQNSEQPLVSRYQNGKDQLSSRRYTRDIREYRQRSVDNKDQFLDRRDFRNTRSVENRRHRGIQIRDVGQREQNMYDRELNLNTRERNEESRERSTDRRARNIDTRERSPDTNERSIDMRERSIDMRERSIDMRERSLNTRERSSNTRERSIDTSRSLENIRQFGERVTDTRSRLYYKRNGAQQNRARVIDNSNSKITTTERRSQSIRDDILENRRIPTFSTTENRTVRAVNIRKTERDISRKDVSRATLSRIDSARQIQNARINLQEFTRRQMSLNSQTGDEVKTLRSTSADRNSEDRRMVPIVEYMPPNRRSFERIDKIRNIKISEKSLKFDSFANVVQLILGMYLIGQIFAHSSKKGPFGFQRILSSMVFAKQKTE